LPRALVLAEPSHTCDWDFSATNDWKFKERYGVQVCAEFFNVLNRNLHSNPAVNLASPSTFGRVFGTAGKAM
jgi:hypothetical protein